MAFPKNFKNFTGIVKKHKWFIIFFILLAVFRLSLTTTGHQYWPDEGRYNNSFTILEKLGSGEFMSAVSTFFDARGRPGFVFLSLIPAAIQIFLAKIGFISPDSLHYYDVTSIFNAVSTLVMALMFYNILLILVKDQKLCLLGTVVYCLLCNTNIYIRHLLPHDLALFPFFVALLLILRANPDLKISTAIICGLLSAFGFLTYSGYYLFVIIIAAVIFFTARKKIKPIFFYFLSAGLSLVFLEVISRAAGNSFFKNSIGVSGDVTQGSFEEGYTFLLKYLVQVEGVIGIALIALFFVYVFFVMWKKSSPLRLAFIMLVLGYLLHATLSVFFHEMVFYGRILHMYMPFFVIAAIMVIEYIPIKKAQTILAGIIIVLSLVSFTKFAHQYSRLDYPEDFRDKYLSSIPKKFICKASEAKLFNKIPMERCLALGVNAEYLYPIPSWVLPVNPEPKLIPYQKALHPINFSAHQFEGFAIRERERIRKRKYEMRLYLRPFVYASLNKELKNKE